MIDVIKNAHGIACNEVASSFVYMECKVIVRYISGVYYPYIGISVIPKHGMSYFKKRAVKKIIVPLINRYIECEWYHTHRFDEYLSMWKTWKC